MKNAIYKDTVKEIKNTYKRFLSILLVVLLGVGFFAGIKATSPDMKKTVDKYFDDLNVMDIQVISTLGLTNDDIEIIKQIEEIENVEGSYSQDVIVSIDEEDAVIKLETITNEMNQLEIIDGRLPENENECVVESSFLTWTGHQIGDSVEITAEKITDSEGEEKELLKEDTMTIVGTVNSPMYLSRERGSSKLGSGTIKYYMFVNKAAINADIYTTAYVQVKDAKELNCTSNQYKEIINEAKDKIEEISNARKQARYDEIYNEADTKIKDAEKELAEEKKKAEDELNSAQKKIDDAKKELEDGRRKLEDNRNTVDSEFANAEAEIKQAEKELIEVEETFNVAKKEAEEQISESKKNVSSLKNIQTQYNTAKKNIETKEKELDALNAELQSLDPVEDNERIREITNQIEKLSQEIYILQATISTIEENLLNQGINANSLVTVISSTEKKIQEAERELIKQEDEIEKAKKELSSQKSRLKTEKTNAYAKIEEAERKIEDAENEIAKNEKKLDNAKKEADEKISDAEEKLEEAKLELEDIKKPEWYILDREKNVGYASYVQDTDRIAKIATVFPIVFFAVAALISLTSMSRMVEEERVQIGTLKALGYTKIQIASKYIIYALLATIIGAGVGVIIGFRLLPAIIADMYGMMYTLPNVILEFNGYYAFIGTIFAILCTVGATIYSCVKELKQVPATLMRPKAPKSGKRVILENVHFIWSKLSFIQKVTARNIFRYKKRFFMTIIGVMGSTALILAGFGIRDSIARMIPVQYGEIFQYDAQVSLKDNITSKQIEEAVEKLKQIEEISGLLKINTQSVEITSIENNQSIQLIIPENTESISDFIKLESRVNKNESYSLNSEGVIITEKLAKVLNIQKGDTIKIKNTDDVEKEVKVDQITENYLMHYMYMSPELYQELYGEAFKANSILINTIELSEEGENNLGTQILKDKDYVAGITFVSNTEGIFSDVMENMNLVVWILIISAGLLAFVVLYNLANTNISERIRELATIKVLGFYDREVYEYVSRETTILTIIGILIGLVAGFFLTMFIITTCELDMLMFTKEVKLLSYIYAMVITIIFSMIVNIATYFALKKIDMIESLKSIE